MTEYISVTKIKSTNNQDNNKVYQVQGNCDGNLIMHVGNMKQPHDILIKEFLIPNYKCFMVSRIYDIIALTTADKHKIFQMIKIIVTDTSEHSHPAFSLCYNFQPHTNILDKISTSKSKIPVNGIFSITLHFADKYIVLRQYDTYSDNDTMMSNLIELLISDEVQDFIKQT